MFLNMVDIFQILTTYENLKAVAEILIKDLENKIVK